MNARLLVFLLFQMFSQLLNSQEVWTLEKCIKHAVDNNIQIRQQNLSAESAAENKKQSLYSMTPTLNASINQQNVYGQTIDPYSFETYSDNRRTNSLNLNSNVVLFQGFQKVNTYYANDYNLKASLLAVEKERNDVTLNVAAAYMQILFNDELRMVSVNQVELSRQQMERTEKLVAAGKIAESDLYDIKAQLAQDELNLVNAQNQYEQSLLVLTQLLELTGYAHFEIQKPDESILKTDSPIDSLSTIINDALAFLPEIKNNEMLVKSSQYRLQAARGYQLPSISFSAGYGTYYSNKLQLLNMNLTPPEYFVPSIADQFNDNRNLSLMLTLSVPIFNGYQIRNSINQSRINVNRSKNNLELTKKIVYKDIQQAYLNAISAQKRYIASEEAVKANRESFRNATLKYENGIMTAMDYSIIKNKLTKSESDLLQAKYEFVFRSRQLDFYRGKDFQM